MSQETGQHRPHACKHVANVKFPLNVTCSASEPRNTLFRRRRDTQLPNPLTAQPRGPDFNGIHVPCPPPPRRLPTPHAHSSHWRGPGLGRKPLWALLGSSEDNRLREKQIKPEERVAPRAASCPEAALRRVVWSLSGLRSQASLVPGGERASYSGRVWGH